MDDSAQKGQRMRYFSLLSALSLILWCSIGSATPDKCASVMGTGSVFDDLRGLQRLSSFVSRAWRIRRSWDPSNFTDPAVHDSRSFRYVIHSETQGTLLSSYAFKDLNSLPETIGLVDLLKYPKDIWKKWVLSASVIDQSKRGSLGDYGLILKVPTENFVASNRRDMDSNHGFQPFISKRDAITYSLALQRKYGLQTPEKLLEKTQKYRWNEVIIWGEGPSGTKVEAIGIYLIAKKGGKLRSGTLEHLPHLKELSEVYALPIVTIESPDESPE
jgi:hypothetical protein